MDHPDIGAELNRIDNPVGIALEGQRDLDDAGAKPMQGLRKIGLAALGRNRKRRDANRLCPCGNFSNSLITGLSQETGRVSRTSAIRYGVHPYR